MIKKFFKEHKVHNKVSKYFDILFLFNIPYFFISWMIFCWGMGAAYYIENSNQNYYFLTSFELSSLMFFLGYTIFLCGINIRIQLDDLSILDWEKVSEKHKTNLNYLYVSPNFVSLVTALKFSNISVFGFLIIAILKPLCIIPLSIYYLVIFKLNAKFLKTPNFNYFLMRCFLKLLSLYLLFVSGWLYFGSFDFYNFLSYLPLFIMSAIPIILVNEVLFFDKFSDKETANRSFIDYNKKYIALVSLLCLFSLFLCSYYLFEDPITSHYSIITIPFFFYALFRSKKKDFERCFSYPVMTMNILISWTLFPFLFIAQLFIYYLSKYYFWHRFNTHFPKFVIEDNN